MVGDYVSYQVLLVCSIVTVTFMFFNLPGFISQERQIFVGETGSMFVELVIVYFLIKPSLVSDSIKLAPPVASWFIAIPLPDMLKVIALRLV